MSFLKNLIKGLWDNQCQIFIISSRRYEKGSLPNSLNEISIAMIQKLNKPVIVSKTKN